MELRAGSHGKVHLKECPTRLLIRVVTPWPVRSGLGSATLLRLVGARGVASEPRPRAAALREGATRGPVFGDRVEAEHALTQSSITSCREIVGMARGPVLKISSRADSIL